MSTSPSAGANSAPQRQPHQCAGRADHERLGVQHPLDLPGARADGPQEAELAAPLRDGVGERRGHDEDGDETGQRRSAGEHLHADPAHMRVLARLRRTAVAPGVHPPVPADDRPGRGGDLAGVGAGRGLRDR
jgi:hypothetical protein